MRVHSCPPNIRGILSLALAISDEVGTYFHTIMFSAGTYLALPIGTFTCAPVVLRGVGILRTTLFAFNFPSKFARRCIVYSTRDLVGSVTCVCSLNGRLMLDVDRYLLISTAL